MPVFELEKRQSPSKLMALYSPALAIGMTLVTTGILFFILGIAPLEALFLFFVSPLLESWTLQQVAVKASPLILIGVGLSVCYRSNNWNIGAEGQFTVGAIVGSILPILLPEWQNAAVLPLMFIMGAIGGGLFGLVPAWLKNRFGANEILTSLMLTYVALLFLDWIVRGPWRDPDGFNFPVSREFSEAALLPQMIEYGSLHAGVLVSLVVVGCFFVLFRYSLKGFEIKVLGTAPRAGSFAGFSKKKMVYFSFAVSGSLAGLAGIIEIAGPIEQLIPSISPGYGFTAIIVAFLGRLNPVGILFAGILLAVTYIGGEAAQTNLEVSDKTAKAIQGILLFYVLACDTLIRYRLRFVKRKV
ncbi:MAG: ABC transporter permease [Cohaesibacteraceae bacterium]|nr:ABC transporter permease [Cohaesibacteraceae bacterium]